MQSLLSASENNVLQSFLSVMDYPDDALTAKEWALLSSHSVPTSSDNASLVESATPNSGHKEELAKATKDLMFLEPEHWHVQSVLQNSQERGLQHHTMHREFHHRRQQQQSVLALNTSFSFSQGKLQLDPQLALMDGLKPSSSSSSPSTSHSERQTVPQQLSHQLTDPSSNGHQGSSTRNTTNPSSSSPSSSRQAVHPPSASSSSTASSSSSPSTSKHTSSSKRNRASSSTSPTSPETQSQKQSLLSPSQKKANHIQSEQKRRANIRRGYEALCETVPALREAIKQEEEEAASTAEKLNGGSARRKRKKGQGKDGGNGEKDKADGRAGPRSENVVLTKTIEHIEDLLSDRSALLARLQRARSMLPTGHPALTPLQIDPPWERQWNGGKGKAIADGEEEGASSEGDADG